MWVQLYIHIIKYVEYVDLKIEGSGRGLADDKILFSSQVPGTKKTNLTKNLAHLKVIKDDNQRNR
jgi:hypothetical protein